jgi:hypothetical protein
MYIAYTSPDFVSVWSQEVSKSSEVSRLDNDMYNALLPYWTVK